MWQDLENRFKEETRRWLSKGGNFQKHVNYLTKTLLKGLSHLYDQDGLGEALEAFKSDPDEGVKLIYDCLKDALREKYDREREKGERILQAYRTGTLRIERISGDTVEVESETTRGKLYRVDLKDGSCTCPSSRTLSYAGVWCKHAMAAYLLYGKPKSRESVRKEESTSSPILVSELPQIKENGERFILYGRSRLRIRRRIPSSLIPDEVIFFLEDEAPEMVMYALEKGEPLLIIGESGTGKSKLIQALAWATNTPLLTPCGHSEVTVESLLGCFIARDGSTIWQNGALPEAMRRDYWLLLEEINAIDPGVLKVLNEPLDTGRITITIGGRPKVVRATEGFRLICTSNPPENPIYRGIEPLSFELYDRFPVVVRLDYLSPQAEMIAVERLSGFSDKDKLERMISFANKVREGMRNGEIFGTVTTRSLIEWAKKIELFGLKAAAHMTVLNKFDPQSYQKALDLLDAYFEEGK
jgi:MoxR-like ATPase